MKVIEKSGSCDFTDSALHILPRINYKSRFSTHSGVVIFISCEQEVVNTSLETTGVVAISFFFAQGAFVLWLICSYFAIFRIVQKAVKKYVYVNSNDGVSRWFLSR